MFGMFALINGMPLVSCWTFAATWCLIHEKPPKKLTSLSLMRQHQLSRGNLTPDGVLLSMEIPHTLGLGFWVMMKRWYASRISRTKNNIVFIQVEVDELSLQIQSPNVRWLGCIIILSERYLGSTILRRWLHPWGMIWFRLNILCFLRLKLVILTGCRWRWAKRQVENSQSTVGPGMDYHHTGAKSSHVMRDGTWQDLMYCRYIFIYYIPASSKWPFDSPIGGHLSPEKVAYWFKRGHFEEPGIYIYTYVCLQHIYSRISGDNPFMFILLSIPFLMNSLRFWGHGGQLLDGHPQAGFSCVPFVQLVMCGSDGTRKDQKTDTMRKKVKKDMKWNTSQVLWKDFMGKTCFLSWSNFFGPLLTDPPCDLYQYGPIWRNSQNDLCMLFYSNN